MAGTRTIIGKLRARMVGPRPPIAVRLTLAALAILATAALRNMVFAQFAPWFLFTPAVVLVALFLGGDAGVGATLLSALGAGWAVSSRAEPLILPPVYWVASVIFVLTTLGLVGLVVALRAALRNGDAARGALDAELAASAGREAFLSGVLSSSTDCIKVLDPDGRLTFMSEGGQRVMEISDFNAVVGCPWPDFWQGVGNAEAEEAVAAARAGEARSFVGQASTYSGTPRWWHVAVSPIRDAAGRTTRILSVSRDITALRASEEERDRFVRLAENSTDFIAMADTAGRIFYLNDAARRLVGLESADIGQLAMGDLFPAEQARIVADEVVPAVDREGHWEGELSFRHVSTGEIIPVLYSAFPITAASGEIVGYGTVTRDFRDRKRAEEDLRLLNGELAHRLKNVLAVVQSIAQQTLRGSADIRQASASLSARLATFGQATDVLTASSWRSADLRGLVERVLSPHGGIGERIIVDGPRITLRPQVAVALALALHELATNAVKYGALSTDGGTVHLAWEIGGAGGEERRFTLRWQERGGPRVAEPTRRGFGSTLIERSLRSYFNGRAVSSYRPDGLVFELDARLRDAAMEDVS